MTTAEAVIGFVLLIAAGSLAIPGWLLNERDRERRYQCRMFAWMALLADFMLWAVRDLDRHTWWAFAIDAIALGYAMNRVRHWWRSVESIREVKRALSTRPEWLP